MPCTNQKTYNPINPGSKPPSPLSLWRAGQRRSSDNAEPNPPSRPQAKQRCESISGSGVVDPSGSPEGSALWCLPQRHGCRAEPCRPPRRRPLRRGVLAAKARVQGRALPPAAQAAPPARSACRKGTGAGQSPAARRAGGPSGEECSPRRRAWNFQKRALQMHFCMV